MDIVAFIKRPQDPKYRAYLGYFFKHRLPSVWDKIFDAAMAKFETHQKKLVPIQITTSISSPVDHYWTKHLVRSTKIKSASMSKKILARRFRQYPKFQELMELYGSHQQETILDYGCGPGNDLVGFALFTRAKKIIGLDISSTALRLARARLSLHVSLDPKKISLIQVSDKTARIPTKNKSIDFIHSEGVLHHTSQPSRILKEFYRILRSGSQAYIMVYNRDSIYFHLFTAFQRMILEKKFAGLDVRQAFSKNTDGESCPIVRCYQNQEFQKMGEKAGFKTEYRGGYFLDEELRCFQKFHQIALKDKHLDKVHKDFLRSLKLDNQGYPMYEGKYAGIGGVYKFYKD